VELQGVAQARKILKVRIGKYGVVVSQESWTLILFKIRIDEFFNGIPNRIGSFIEYEALRGISILDEQRYEGYIPLP
jgi:hypothetical protein